MMQNLNEVWDTLNFLENALPPSGGKKYVGFDAGRFLDLEVNR